MNAERNIDEQERTLRRLKWRLRWRITCALFDVAVILYLLYVVGKRISTLVWP